MSQARLRASTGRCAAVASVAVGLALSPGSSQASSHDCFGGLRSVLERDGYTGNMDCSLVHQTIEYVGRTRSAHGPSYLVYQLTYRTRTHGWGVAHGGGAILIFDRHLRYLGGYRIMAGYRLRIDGADVVVNLPAADGNRVHLGGETPPPTEHLDGDYVTFDK